MGCGTGNAGQCYGAALWGSAAGQLWGSAMGRPWGRVMEQTHLAFALFWLSRPFPAPSPHFRPPRPRVGCGCGAAPSIPRHGAVGAAAARRRSGAERGAFGAGGEVGGVEGETPAGRGSLKG